MNGFIVHQPGVLTLIQDAGRYGTHNIGLTTGGPIDSLAFKWANRLCGNNLNSTLLEVSVGGLQIEARVNTKIAVTGANMLLTINGQVKELWRTHSIKIDDIIELAYTSSGLRCYLSVSGGFNVNAVFGSTATVCREGIGGLNGDKLSKGDFLLCSESLSESNQHLSLPSIHQPVYKNEIILRTVLGYQHQHFSSVAQRLFFHSEYIVSERCNRMGYRLTGQKIETNINGILSEGICQGAIQVPADGQPIVLLNDRQTIGGYPKIGSVLSLDTAKLGQLNQGGKVRFEAVSLEEAHNINLLESIKFENTTLTPCS